MDDGGDKEVNLGILDMGDLPVGLFPHFLLPKRKQKKTAKFFFDFFFAYFLKRPIWLGTDS